MKPNPTKPKPTKPKMERQWPARRQLVKERARTRLGVDVGKLARQSMIRRVHKGDVRYSRKLTNSRTVIVLEYEGRELAFLYSSASGEIISFLTPDAPEVAEWGQLRRGREAALAKPIRRPCFRVEGTHR
jgi:hypothetical protein